MVVNSLTEVQVKELDSDHEEVNNLEVGSSVARCKVVRVQPGGRGFESGEETIIY